MPTTPVLLIGTKSDLRSDAREISLMASQGQSPITPQEGQSVANEIGAKKYLECSAKTGRGVMEVFDAAVKETISRGMMDGWKGGGSGAGGGATLQNTGMTEEGKGRTRKRCVIL